MSASTRKPRKANRLKKRIQARFEMDGASVPGFVLNLSELGLYLQTRKVLRVGSPISIYLSGNDSKEIPLQGRVVSNQHANQLLTGGTPGGMGIALTTPPPDYVRFVETLKA